MDTQSDDDFIRGISKGVETGESRSDSFKISARRMSEDVTLKIESE